MRKFARESEPKAKLDRLQTGASPGFTKHQKNPEDFGFPGFFRVDFNMKGIYNLL